MTPPRQNPGALGRVINARFVAGSGALELLRVQGFKKWYARPVMLRYADIRISSAFFRLSGGCSALELQDGKWLEGRRLEDTRSRYEFHPETPAAGLHAPMNAKPCFAGVVLPESWRALRLWQLRKDLSLLLGDDLRLRWSSFLPSVPQPLWYVLDYGHVGLLMLRVENWRKARVARPPPLSRTLFSRQVQPAYICLPSTNWLPGLDSHQHRTA